MAISMSAEILHFVPMSEMPNRIRELRVDFHLRVPGETKMSQQRLGDATGFSKMTISDLERGAIALSTDHMRRIARVLRIDAAELLHKDDTNMQLTAAELALIERFRSGDEGQQSQLLDVARVIIPAQEAKVA